MFDSLPSTEAILLIVIGLYGLGMLLPLVVHRNAHLQNLIAHGAATLAALSGVALGLAGLLVDTPPVFSLPSTLPLLTIQFRLDPLSAFFVLLISITGVAVSIYAMGYVREFESRYSIGLLGGLYNAFLLSMTLVVMADDAVVFLILWEIMSIVSYLLVVTEHDKTFERMDSRVAAFSPLGADERYRLCICRILKTSLCSTAQQTRTRRVVGKGDARTDLDQSASHLGGPARREDTCPDTISAAARQLLSRWE